MFILGYGGMSHISNIDLTEYEQITPRCETVDQFPVAISMLAEQHRPSRMPFFRNLAALDHAAASDPSFLGQIHLVYQSAMHSTRAAVYYLPHLDSPALRKRKLQIFIDDDGLPGGDTHHYQLTRAFKSIGARCTLDDEEFGDPEELCRHLSGETAHFVRVAQRLYSRSLGPWCAIETLSADWMQALAQAFSAHFPQFKEEPYFAECFSQMVEEHHAAEAIEAAASGRSKSMSTALTPRSRSARKSATMSAKVPEKSRRLPSLARSGTASP